MLRRLLCQERGSSAQALTTWGLMLCPLREQRGDNRRGTGRDRAGPGGTGRDTLPEGGTRRDAAGRPAPGYEPKGRGFESPPGIPILQMRKAGRRARRPAFRVPGGHCAGGGAGGLSRGGAGQLGLVLVRPALRGGRRRGWRRRRPGRPGLEPQVLPVRRPRAARRGVGAGGRGAGVAWRWAPPGAWRWRCGRAWGVAVGPAGAWRWRCGRRGARRGGEAAPAAGVGVPAGPAGST